MTDEADAILEPHRRYLRALADLHLDGRLRGKLDPSDLVQQAMLRAHPALGGLRDRDPAAVRAWLRAILASTLADAARHFARDKRDVRRERSVAANLDRTASGLAAGLAADETSPSGRAIRDEELVRLAEALGRLPDAMREVVVLKHCRGLTLAQIRDETGRTVPAIASLLRRGLEQLRHQLDEDD